MYLITQMLNGLGAGSIYALIALGYSMVYGVVKLINFAHGDIIMVGSYMIFLTLGSGQPLWVAVLVSISFSAIMGVLIEQIAYRRLLNSGAPRIALLITAIGASIFLQNLAQLVFGANQKSMPKMFQLPAIRIGDMNVSNTLLNIIVAFIMMAFLQVLIHATKTGKAMRATSEDSGAAQLMGININRIIIFTFAVGSALAAVGAVLYTNTYMQIKPLMGGMLGLKAFVAAVFGGIGSIPGAMLGGFLLGLAESLSVVAGQSKWMDAAVFALLIIILLVRPSGLLGKHMKEKV
ncbi:MAG: branched-chain amino acid ABC transporter permease [Clostridiales bacterium]|nr:branched-chain amino acid ABC transporter permease [Clostridiales bacterium]MDD2572039.1 branched-chain amino acid ABC transporter permease [Eubacteriales bacterium]NLG30231.1 branched-chain amino acid ABC transporter permease [Clostridiaceae bacterium]MCK9350172.1 branched-chain amino acid ABC transporter permease [Clostridiales bacterium]MDD3418721.1 branched-chain amino acid ABC transporter permease [Eubacteriales bacterium]